MPNLFYLFSEYYYLVIGLQAVCVWHSYRRGTMQKWIWLIVFLPLVGSLLYIFTEIIQKRHVSSATGSILSFVNPGGRIKKLEHNYNFSGTFTNRIALADAYLDAGMYDKAIGLYEPVLTGIFDNSDGAIRNLIKAYYKTGQFNELVKIAPRIIKSLDFTKTQANLYYALALEELGRFDEAEAEFKKMCHRFCNYEQRYNYGCFLLRREKYPEAREVFEAAINESEFLSGREKSEASEWIGKAKQEVKKTAATSGATR